jgi:hypothetical protein
MSILSSLTMSVPHGIGAHVRSLRKLSVERGRASDEVFHRITLK